MSIHFLNSIEFTIDYNLLLQTFKLNEASPAAEGLQELIETAKQIGKPKVLYKEAIVTNKGHDYLIIDGIKFHSQLLSCNVGTNKKIYPYILTCGTELAYWAKSLKELLEIYWADKLMELALNAAVTTFEQHLQEHYQLSNTSNMNPGALEDWPLSEQKPLFSLFGPALEQIGVHLTDSYLMVPLKSLSGIRFYSEKQFVNCQLCTRAACPNRRIEGGLL